MSKTRHVPRAPAALRAAPLLVILSLALTACDSNSGGKSGLKQQEAVAVPAMDVDLPAAPNFKGADLPQSFPEGQLTVFGLRKQINEYLGKDVTVKAYLLEIYQCPECPKGQECPLCDQPHFFLSDKPDGNKERALIVVDYLGLKDKPPALTVGKMYDVDGRFNRTSPRGFAASDGLLVFNKLIDDSGKEYFSPDALMEAEMMAEAAKEMEKAARLKGAASKKQRE